MSKMQEYIVKNNRIFVGLEDSKRTWKVCVRCNRMIVHQTSMPTKYDNLRNYLKNQYPGCEINTWTFFFHSYIFCKLFPNLPTNSLVVFKKNYFETY